MISFEYPLVLETCLTGELIAGIVEFRCNQLNNSVILLMLRSTKCTGLHSNNVFLNRELIIFRVRK